MKFWCGFYEIEVDYAPELYLELDRDPRRWPVSIPDYPYFGSVKLNHKEAKVNCVFRRERNQDDTGVITIGTPDLKQAKTDKPDSKIALKYMAGHMVEEAIAEAAGPSRSIRNFLWELTSNKGTMRGTNALIFDSENEAWGQWWSQQNVRNKKFYLNIKQDPDFQFILKHGSVKELERVLEEGLASYLKQINKKK